MARPKPDILFTALTRPQMFAGVTYGFFVANAVMTAELFLLFKSFWILAAAATTHLAGTLACVKEPRFFDLWFVRLSRAPRIRNWPVWRCNSYGP